MKKNPNGKNAFGRALIFSALFALIGAGIFAYTSLYGYLAGRVVDWMPVYLTVGALALLLVMILFGKKMNGNFAGVLMLAVNVCLAIALCMFVTARIELAADIYFIPVNYPEGEELALNISIAGLGAYILAILSNIFAALGGSFNKKAKAIVPVLAPEKKDD